jgi:hypothetical protein
MKEAKDLTTADLIDEKRRWIIAPGDYVKGKGYRVEAIFENHPFTFEIGKVTNLPTNRLGHLPYFPAKADTKAARKAASDRAEQWSLKNNGIDQKAYCDILMSWMKAYNLGKIVKVMGDHLDRIVLQNGFGDEIRLDEEAATELYQDLATVLDLPCQRNCPKCDGIMDDDACEECDS